MSHANVCDTNFRETLTPETDPRVAELMNLAQQARIKSCINIRNYREMLTKQRKLVKRIDYFRIALLYLSGMKSKNILSKSI